MYTIHCVHTRLFGHLLKTMEGVTEMTSCIYMYTQVLETTNRPVSAVNSSAIFIRRIQQLLQRLHQWTIRAVIAWSHLLQHSQDKALESLKILHTLVETHYARNKMIIQIFKYQLFAKMMFWCSLLLLVIIHALNPIKEPEKEIWKNNTPKNAIMLYLDSKQQEICYTFSLYYINK